MILSNTYTSVFSPRWASVATLMYHGTDTDNLPSILSQGLIPNPKKRAWQDDPNQGFSVPSRASLPGIYLTTNLSTALSSGSKRGNRDRTLVVVQVQSGNLLADEDDLKYQLNDSIPSHEYSVMSLYTAWQALKQDLPLDAYTKRESLQFLNKAQQTFIDNILSRMEYKIKGGLTPQERDTLTPILKDGFFVALTRRASYVGKYSWGYESQNHGVPIPPSGPAEADFKKLEDRLTRLLKRLGRPEHLEQKFAPTARIETPIRFSGKNKIISIIRVLPYVPGQGTRVQVLFPESGRVPDKLIQDWNQAQGPWDGAVNNGQDAESFESS